MSDVVSTKVWAFSGVAIVCIAVYSGVGSCERGSSDRATDYKLRVSHLENQAYVSPQEQAELTELRQRIAKDDADKLGG